MTGMQRISYVAPDQVDDDMRAELERCARYGTPRPAGPRLRPAQPAYMSDPGVVRSSPDSSHVFRPERIIGQPP